MGILCCNAVNFPKKQICGWIQVAWDLDWKWLCFTAFTIKGLQMTSWFIIKSSDFSVVVLPHTHRIKRFSQQTITGNLVRNVLCSDKELSVVFGAQPCSIISSPIYHLCVASWNYHFGGHNVV